MNDVVKAARHTVVDAMNKYNHQSDITRAKRIMRELRPFMRSVAEAAYMLGRVTDNPLELNDLLLQHDLIEKKEAEWLPASTYLHNFGKDLDVIKPERKNLIQRYHVGDLNIKVNSWFNASIIEFEGKTFMAYRVDTIPFTVNTRIAICELDQYLQPLKDTNHLLNLASTSNFYEDPRLFAYQGKLMVTYADGYTIGLAEINTADWSTHNNRLLRKPYSLRPEKNWTFFEHGENLYSIYSINPHRIYQVTDTAMTKAFNNPQFTPHGWEFGPEFRGGSSPVLHGEYYYSFFHTHLSHDMTDYLEREYHMGCYVFYKDPPFNVVAYSKMPLMSGPYMDRMINRGGRYHAIVFPCGAIFRDGEWIVSCGLNDFEIGMVMLPESVVEQNLIWL